VSVSGQGRESAGGRRLALWLALLVLTPGAVPAQDTAVSLPPFLVEEAAKGPPWRHGEAMGF